VKITKLGRPLPLISGGSLFDGDSTPGSPFTPGPPGHVPTSNGSNSYAWSSNVALITSNGSNLVSGPFVNFASGSGVFFAVASNTLTVSALSDGKADLRAADIETHHRFIITAHMGDVNSTDGYPEGSLEAYRQAVKKGVHRVDIDCRQSSDGTWWSMHDATLNRTTNLTGNISAATDATINGGHIDGGTGYDAGRHGSSIAIPTVVEILTALAAMDCTFQLDNKLGTAASAQSLAALVRSLGLSHRCVFNVYGGSTEQNALTAAAPEIGQISDRYTSNDWATPAWDALVDVDDVYAYAPRKVTGVVDRTDYGSADEEAIVEFLWGIGARGITCNDVEVSVAAWRALEYGGGAGGTVDIEDEGSAEGAADTIDFVGAGVSVSFSAGEATVTIPGGNAFVGWRVYNSGNVALSTAAETEITFNSERYDTDAFHSTVTNTGRATIPSGKAGKYGVGFNVRVTNTPGDPCYALIQHVTSGGSATVIALQYIPNNGNIPSANVYTEWDAAVGDYFRCFVYAQTASKNATANSGYSPEFYGHLIG
jgi:hypothetical protein